MSKISVFLHTGKYSTHSSSMIFLCTTEGTTTENHKHWKCRAVKPRSNEYIYKRTPASKDSNGKDERKILRVRGTGSSLINTFYVNPIFLKKIKNEIVHSFSNTHTNSVKSTFPSSL